MRKLFDNVSLWYCWAINTEKNLPTHKKVIAPTNFPIYTSLLNLSFCNLFSQTTPRGRLDLCSFIQFSKPTKMNIATGTQGPLPNKYVGTYLAKPVTVSICTTPSWGSFIATRMGPTTIGDLPAFLEKFSRVHVGNLDPKFAILIGVLRQCHPVVETVYWFLEQVPVKENPEILLLLNRALFRNHEIWNKVADTMQKCIEKSPGAIYLFRLGRLPNAFDKQYSTGAKILIEKLVKKTMRDPRSWNLFRRKFLVDEIREYILTTNMLIQDIEDELDRRRGPESEPEPRISNTIEPASCCATYGSVTDSD